MLRAPNYGYASPAPYTDALRTIDDFDLFSGTTDPFTGTLIGSAKWSFRTTPIEYTATQWRWAISSANTPSIRYLLRYELHCVWVVEARLKPDAKHIYSRRVFYLDEDSWQAATSDSYDRG